ncbi:MAG: rhodanese-like domain-containing protein [Chitinophagaceae bacterium]|nr:rhodanese-like domain-containing protein [Chitinophagaceae bacterium]
MRNSFCLPVALVFSFAVNAQFKNDNVLYKTVDPADLCATLAANKGYLLLDVRTAGEFHDTSSSPSYNLGHLKGAININVRELGTKLAEIKAYKDKPVFIYCSHSQRSRRAGKMLADSGFTKLFNINGGMTALHYSDLKQKGCLNKMVETRNNYSIISAVELCGKMIQTNKPFLLDVRPDSAFRHISRDAKENAYGAFAFSVNIPLADLAKRIKELPRNQEIIITDIYGDEATQAAELLIENSFSKVSVLIEGIDRLLQMDEKEVSCKNSLYRSPVKYEILSTVEFGRYAKKNKNFMLLDIRTSEEFANKHSENWRNIGHLKDAVNIPAADLEQSIAGLGTDKTKEIIIYGLGGSPEVFAVASGLYKEGFTNIKVLAGGIFNLRWTAGNVKGQSFLHDWVIDIPETNQ